jgi:hypothetical protein
MGTLTIVTKHITETKQGGHKEYMTYNMLICISVGDPCISPANHLFCGHNHENENESGPNHGPAPALDRSLDVAAVNAHARNVHEPEDEVDSSKPSRCVDDTAQGTHDGLDHSRHVVHHRVDRYPGESEVVGMASGCHHACGGEASPDEGDVVGMVTDCHLARGGAANRGENNEAVLTSDDENGGRECDLTHPIRCRNLTT